MLDSDFYQLMSTTNNTNNNRGGSNNNNNNGSTLIGTTIKAPLEDVGGSGRSNKSSSSRHQSRGRTKRIPRRSKGATSRPRSNSNDAHNNNMMMMEPNNQAPLFGGNNSSNSNNNKNSHPAGDFGNYRDDCEDFNNSMYGTDVSTTYDDAASAETSNGDGYADSEYNIFLETKEE